MRASTRQPEDSGDGPPILDVGGLGEPGSGALERLAASLEGPCRDWGAFQIVGHGIPETELAAFDDAVRTLFALPPERLHAVRRTRENARGYYDQELTKQRPDWKQVFDYGAERPPGSVRHSDGSNQWPDGLGDARDVLLRHYQHCERVGLQLLEALCVSLDLPPDALAGDFVDHSSFVRLNRYPPCETPADPQTPGLPSEGHFGVHHHTDAGALTLVVQDEVGGLQVRKDDRWVVVEPVPGALVVNLGDMLQVCSNDRYLSPLHRVMVHPDRERFSAPFFLNPAYESEYAPLPALLAGGEPARFRAIRWAHFRDQRSAGDFADYGAEIQIDDFRID